MSGLNGQHSGRAGMLSGVAAAIAGMTVNWASSPGNLLPSGFSLTRASDGTYFDSAGLLQTAATDVARGTYRYNGSAWVFDGTMIEAAATNLTLRNTAYSNATWARSAGTFVADNSVVSPDGTSNASTIQTTVAGTDYLAQQYTVLASTAYVYSWWIKRGTATDMQYSVYNNSTPGDLIAPTSYYSQTNSSTWTRVSFSFTTPVGCTSIFVYPLRTATPVGTQFIFGDQLELGTSPTSTIYPTAAATVTRNADVVTAPTSGLLVNAQGFAAIGGRIIAQNGSGPWAMLACAAGEGWPLYFANSTSPSRLALYDGTSIINFGASTQIPAAGTAFKAATAWSGIVASGALNGTVGSPSAAFDSSLGLGTTIRIGDVPAGGFPISMVLQSMRLGVQTVNNSRLANPFA